MRECRDVPLLKVNAFIFHRVFFREDSVKAPLAFGSAALWRAAAASGDRKTLDKLTFETRMWNQDGSDIELLHEISLHFQFLLNRQFFVIFLGQAQLHNPIPVPINNPKKVGIGCKIKFA